MFRKGVNGGCSITVIGSTPLKGDYYDSVVVDTLQDEPYISDDGNLSKTHMLCLVRFSNINANTIMNNLCRRRSLQIRFNYTTTRTYKFSLRIL